MYETYNYLINYIKTKKKIKNLKENYRKILICFCPIIPHFSYECLKDLELSTDVKWPDFDKSVLSEEKINFVIQINGKKRAILNEKKDITETILLEKLKKDKIVNKYLNKKEIKKIIFVKNRLINILINE